MLANQVYLTRNRLSQVKSSFLPNHLGISQDFELLTFVCPHNLLIAVPSFKTRTNLPVQMNMRTLQSCMRQSSHLKKKL